MNNPELKGVLYMSDWSNVFGEIDYSRFSEEQQKELKIGEVMNLPVQLYANPMYTPEEMHRYRNILQTSLYAINNPEEKVVATHFGPQVVSPGFKSLRNYELYPDSVCYIPENWDFEDGPGWTAKEILKLCDMDKIKADAIFSLCDWQSPSTVLDEWDKDDDIALLELREEALNIQREYIKKVCEREGEKSSLDIQIQYAGNRPLNSHKNAHIPIINKEAEL